MTRPSTVSSSKLTIQVPSFPYAGENLDRQSPESVPPAVACSVVTVTAGTRP